MCPKFDLSLMVCLFLRFESAVGEADHVLQAVLDSSGAVGVFKILLLGLISWMRFIL